MYLEQWEQGAEPGPTTYDDGAELFVLDGEFADKDGEYAKGSWLRLPPESAHQPRSLGGCTLYVKTGGLAYLESSAG